jgi:hypothetical protein
MHQIHRTSFIYIYIYIFKNRILHILMKLIFFHSNLVDKKLIIYILKKT